jgi:hypothetical protein
MALSFVVMSVVPTKVLCAVFFVFFVTLLERQSIRATGSSSSSAYIKMNINSDITVIGVVEAFSAIVIQRRKPTSTSTRSSLLLQKHFSVQRQSTIEEKVTIMNIIIPNKEIQEKENVKLLLWEKHQSRPLLVQNIHQRKYTNHEPLQRYGYY